MFEISGYEVLSKIGEGGMASVYLAKQLSLDRLVAVKVLANPQAPEAKARFLSEAKTLAAVSHPSVVNVYDVGELPDRRLYLVMEYLPGGDLRGLKGQALAPQNAIAYVRQIAQGLAFIHAKKIIHRDVKPANILVKDENTVVLSDFGIAKKEDAERDLTREGTSVGSPAYASPEQTTEKALDPRADLYSLGVVFFELLVGRNPFRGSSTTETAMNHLQLDIPRLPEHLQYLQPIVNGLLAKQPEQRFDSAEALIKVMDKCVQSPGSKSPNAIQSFNINRHLALAPVLVCVLILTWWLFVYESEADKQVKTLLTQADEMLAVGQFNHPIESNARYFYEQALLIDQDNQAALKGLADLPKREVAYYLERAAEAVHKGSLHSPTNDNAQYYYNKVLTIDNSNIEAQEGLLALIPIYVQRTIELLQNEDYKRGFQYLSQGLKLDPNNKELLALKKQYQNHSNALKRFLNRVFQQ